MECPICKGKTRVVDCADDGKNVYRTRQCPECKHKFTTTEKESTDGKILNRVKKPAAKKRTRKKTDAPKADTPKADTPKANTSEDVGSRSICWKCQRTGTIEHIKRKLHEPLPAELAPCIWITDGIIPNGADFEERQIQDSTRGRSYTSYCILKCPLYSPKKRKNFQKKSEKSENTP